RIWNRPSRQEENPSLQSFPQPTSLPSLPLARASLPAGEKGRGKSIVRRTLSQRARRSGFFQPLRTQLTRDLIFGDQAEEPVLFVSDSSGEEDTVAKRKQVPQTLKLKRRSIGPSDSIEQSSRARIVIVNYSIAEITNPESIRDQRQSAWVIQVAIRHQAA